LAAGYCLVKESLPSRRGSSGVKVNKGKMDGKANYNTPCFKDTNITKQNVKQKIKDRTSITFS